MAEPGSPLVRADGDLVSLTGTECTACGLRWFPPTAFGCERCGSHGGALKECDLNTSGAIYSFTALPRPDGDDVILALIILDDGPSIRARIDSADAGKIAVGARVHGIATPDAGPGILFRLD